MVGTSVVELAIEPTNTGASVTAIVGAMVEDNVVLGIVGDIVHVLYSTGTASHSDRNNLRAITIGGAPGPGLCEVVDTTKHKSFSIPICNS